MNDFVGLMGIKACLHPIHCAISPRLICKIGIRYVGLPLATAVAATAVTRSYGQ